MQNIKGQSPTYWMLSVLIAYSLCFIYSKWLTLALVLLLLKTLNSRTTEGHTWSRSMAHITRFLPLFLSYLPLAEHRCESNHDISWCRNNEKAKALLDRIRWSCTLHLPKSHRKKNLSWLKKWTKVSLLLTLSNQIVNWLLSLLLTFFCIINHICHWTWTLWLSEKVYNHCTVSEYGSHLASKDVSVLVC